MPIATYYQPNFRKGQLYSLLLAATGPKISNFEGLTTLNFDLLTSKWSHGWPVSWASLLPNFGLLYSSVLQLESGTRPTDNGHHCMMSLPYGGGA